ncbi:hypothetical protein IGK47_000779 [Enterococcus sp. AZ007]
MYKDTKLEINVKAIEPEIFLTKATYYSYDVESGRFVIHLKKDLTDFSIPEGTDLKMTLIKLSDNTKYIVIPEIEDRVKGIISLVIPKILLGYVGGVRAGIFIKPPNSQSVHGGYFTFSMALSDIDDDNEEMVEFYNQLFEDMAVNFEKDVNELMANVEEHAVEKIIEYDKKFEEVETKVSSMENQAANMEVKQEEILKKIVENDVPTKSESSANVIYQVIGKDKVRVSLTLDYQNKIRGSMLENPNWAGAAHGLNNLPLPSDFKNEAVQERYDALASRGEGDYVHVGTVSSNQYPCFDHRWGVLEGLKHFLGEQFFIDRGATTFEEQVEMIKEILIEIKSNVWSFGKGPSGNYVVQAVFNSVGNNWTGAKTNSSSSFFKTTITSSKDGIANIIDDNGEINYIVYSEKSSDSIGSGIYIDHTDLELTFDLSVNEHIKLMMAQNQVENIANIEEAAEGKTDEKLMTPFKTKEFYLNETRSRRQKWDEGLNWIAHRGNNTEYPENSLPAFRSVRRHWGIETDIQVTSDGQWVVMHDSTVDRTTNGSGLVSSMTLAQFRNLRIDTGVNSSLLSDEERIPPTFDEFLLTCKILNRIPVIEIKSGTYSTANYSVLKETLNLFGYDETNCVLGSFDYTVLSKLRNIYTNMELHYFVDSISVTAINNAIELGIPTTISCSQGSSTLSIDNVRLIHAAGLKVGAWTVPDESFDKLIQLGVDYITTNSLSGNLKYSACSLSNGFTDNIDSGRVKESFVEEVGGGMAHISFNVENGSNTQNSVIAMLPDWAVPIYKQFEKCCIRVSSANGDVVLGTFDVNGRIAPYNGTAKSLAVGLKWSNRTSWAAGSTVYKV